MRSYVKNILLYLVALLGILCFISMFSTSLEIYDSVKGTWNTYNVHPYLGESYNGQTIYKGTLLPVFGYIIPLILAILLIVESFKKSWKKNIKVINTIFAILFLFSALFTLLTKELFLKANGYDQSLIIRNGSGPIFAAVCSLVAAVLLLVVSWIPLKGEIQFIEE